jgi:hypothetical protein
MNIRFLCLALLCVFMIFSSGCTFTEPKYDCSVKEGSVNIQNGLDSAAYLKLVDKDKKTFGTLYIPANSQGGIRDICNGRYYLYYEVGDQWDPLSKTFKEVKSRNKFVDPLDFTGDNYYDARTSNVDAKDFPA